MYLIEIKAFSPLSREEETNLAICLRKGDEEAREKLIKHNLRFVVSVAKRYQNLGIPIYDLVAEGNQGLVRAVDKYDYTTGVKFISYAVWWIRQAIMSALSKRKIVHGPDNFELKRFQAQQFVDHYTGEFGKHPTIREVSEKFNVTDSEAELLLSGDDISFDYSSSDDKADFYNIFPDTDEAVEESIACSSEVEWILKVLDSLVDRRLINKRHRKMFLLRMGFTEHGEASQDGVPTLEAIAKSMGVTKEAVRLGEERVLVRLKASVGVARKPVMVRLR